MKKTLHQTDNYFDRMHQKLHLPLYRYYFFDYLYFKGKQWSKKALRCSGAFILTEYWTLIVALPSLAFTDVLHWRSNAIMIYHALILLFPIVFIFFCYRRDRKITIIKHYRRSKSSRATMCLIVILPFALFFLEVWLFDKLGWLNYKL